MGNKLHTWVEIDRAALEHNLLQFKSIVKQGILAPVIKGNAYGHGLLEVGRVCQESLYVDWCCVALLSEALRLRNAGFLKPILVLVHLDDDPMLAVIHDIDIMVYCFETIKNLNSCAQAIKKQCRIHVKIDTGLSRLGIAPNKTIQFIKKIADLPLIQLRGIATHFSQSHTQNIQITQEQMQIFSRVLSKIKREGIEIPYQHLCNSAATIRFQNPLGTFFRPGLSIHGYWSSEHVQNDAQAIHPDLTLKPVLTWKSRIFDIKTVPAGRPVGYDGTFRTTRESRLGVIPIGYADGYSRYYEGGFVRVCDALAPVVGKIGMNTTTLDITDIPDAKVSQEVILIGDYCGIRADQVALRCKKNPREITTTISPRIPRILVEQSTLHLLPSDSQQNKIMLS